MQLVRRFQHQAQRQRGGERIAQLTRRAQAVGPGAGGGKGRFLLRDMGGLAGDADTTKQASGRLWLIAGGQGKGQDFSPLIPLLNEKLAAMVCFGQDRAQLLALASNTYAVTILDEAVAWCATQAQAGDTVLFAPACASLDMYDNYQLRGEHFISLVEALLVEAL